MARVYRRRRGDVLQPQRFTESVIAGFKAKPREWSGQYQQEPSPESGIIFNPNWWKYYKTKEAPEFELIVLSVDCAFRAQAQNDYVSIQKWGQLGPRSYLIDKMTEHLGFAATKAAIKSMQQHGRPASSILIEGRANGDAVAEELRSDPGFGASVVVVEPEGGKDARAHAASADVEAGNVFLPEDQPWTVAFVRTASAFPAVKHDDDIDSFTQFLNWRRNRNLSYAVLDYGKRVMREVAAGIRDRFGVLIHPPAKPVLVSISTKAVQVQVDNSKLQQAKKDKPHCPTCRDLKLELVDRAAVAGGWKCNQCASTFDGAGNLTLAPANTLIAGVNCCDHPLPQVNGTKCGNCGLQSGRNPIEPEPQGMSRRDYFRTHGGFAIAAPRGGYNPFGRFGSGC